MKATWRRTFTRASGGGASTVARTTTDNTPKGARVVELRRRAPLHRRLSARSGRVYAASSAIGRPRPDQRVRAANGLRPALERSPADGRTARGRAHHQQGKSGRRGRASGARAHRGAIRSRLGENRARHEDPRARHLARSCVRRGRTVSLDGPHSGAHPRHHRDHPGTDERRRATGHRNHGVLRGMPAPLGGVRSRRQGSWPTSPVWLTLDRLSVGLPERSVTARVGCARGQVTITAGRTSPFGRSSSARSRRS